MGMAANGDDKLKSSLPAVHAARTAWVKWADDRWQSQGARVDLASLDPCCPSAASRLFGLDLGVCSVSASLPMAEGWN